MNCPDCGVLAYPRARKCHTCGTLLAWPAKPARDAKPLPPDLQNNLQQLGFSRIANEAPVDFAARCRRWLLDRFSNEHGNRAA